MDHKHTNNLIHETSPYLLQHAHNPVNWHAWGKAALQKATDENKVILVSIGYSACHWCHVMERESFEDEETAMLMNENFINIKIDREERPDIDHIYMDAVQAITGSGGWPLNVFLTPGAKPFYGGTYFPPVKAFNRSSWTDVLQNIAQAWKERQNELEAQAENLTDHLNKAGNFINKNIVKVAVEKDFDVGQCENIFAAIMKSADTLWGGFGKAPKFPQTFIIQYLLEFYYFTSNQQALQQALLSIDKMMEGGIYDQMGGGLARYSTDNEWLAPHFEKMLYDNALLILVLCDAYQITKAVKYKLAIEKTIAFVLEELRNEQGGFYSALDADSEGVEGKFYVWQKNEIEKTLGADAAIFCEFFDITQTGNWEETNILRILKPADEFAGNHKLNITHFTKQMDGCLQKLKTERTKRTRPGLDDKVILSWNALMLKAVAKAGVVLQNEKYKAVAITNFNFIWKNFPAGTSPYQLLHTWKNAVAKYPGFLDDYAYLIDAVLQLYEATFDTAYLHHANFFCEYVIENFSDEEALFFYYTHAGQDDVIVRKKEIYDGATPSANAVMAHNLFKLSIIFDKTNWRLRADKMLLSISTAIVSYPASFGIWASLLMQRGNGTNEIAVIGSRSKDIAADIEAGYYLPNKIMMASDTENNLFPMINKKQAASPALIYVCKEYVCQAPCKNLQEFLNTIKIT